MQRHDPTQCIVQNSFGSYHIYPCSVDVAKKLWMDELKHSGANAYEEEQKLLDDPNVFALRFGSIERAFKQIMEASAQEPDEPRNSLRYLKYGPGPKMQKDIDSRPVITYDECKKLQQQLVEWAFANNIPITKLPTLASVVFGYEAKNKNYDLLTLPFMQGIVDYAKSKNKTIKIISDDAAEFLEEKRVLMRDAWKEDARTTSVVQRYLTFMNERLTHRDNRYELGTIELEYTHLIEPVRVDATTPTNTFDGP